MSFTEEVKLEFEGTTFALRQGGEIRVDGVMANPPVNHPNGVVIRKAGGSVVVCTTKHKSYSKYYTEFLCYHVAMCVLIHLSITALAHGYFGMAITVFMDIFQM